MKVFIITEELDPYENVEQIVAVCTSMDAIKTLGLKEVYKYSHAERSTRYYTNVINGEVRGYRGTYSMPRFSIQEMETDVINKD